MARSAGRIEIEYYGKDDLAADSGCARPGLGVTFGFHEVCVIDGGSASPQVSPRRCLRPATPGRRCPSRSPDIWTLYSGDQAFADVKALVDLGPRPAELRRARAGAPIHHQPRSRRPAGKSSARNSRTTPRAGTHQVLQPHRPVRRRPDDPAGDRLLPF